MKNDATRFGLDENGSLFDYAGSRYIAPTGVLADDDGVWDLARVKTLIDAGIPIHSCWTAKLLIEERESAAAALTDAGKTLDEAHQALKDRDARIAELEKTNAALAANLQEADHRLVQLQSTDRATPQPDVQSGVAGSGTASDPWRAPPDEVGNDANGSPVG